MVCTSIGLTVKGVPVIGVIYNPFLDQLVSTDYSSAAPPLPPPIIYSIARLYHLPYLLYTRPSAAPP